MSKWVELWVVGAGVSILTRVPAGFLTGVNMFVCQGVEETNQLLNERATP